jgi:hypothetical protein
MLTEVQNKKRTLILTVAVKYPAIDFRLGTMTDSYNKLLI